MASSVNPRKRRREPVNVDVKLVEIYEDLANEKGEIRLKAAHDLLSRFTPDKNPSNEDIEKVLKRLFRGLCSSRKAARIGFSTALTELLSQVFLGPSRRNSEELNIPKTIEILGSQTSPVNCASGQEERDHHFGRLFGAEAILKSTILLQSDVSFDNWAQLLSLIFDLAKKKPWLREECGYIIYCAVRDIADKKADVQYVDEIIKGLSKNGLAKTPEGIAIWLAAMECPSPVTFVLDVWQSNNPLHTKEKTALAKIMKESSDPHSERNGENGTANKSSVWNPKLHFAWDPILARLYKLSRNKKEDRTSKQVSFIDFWTEVVDTGLFAASSSEERKYWGFLVFMKVVNEGPKEIVGSIFTKNFVRSLINQLSGDDRYLHRIAQKAAKSIQTRGVTDPEFINLALQGLMGPAGAVNFDQVTKTKTIEKLIGEGPTGGLDRTVPFLQSLIVQPGVDDAKAAGSRRQQFATLLTSIVKSLTTKSSTPDDLDSTIKRVMLVLARFAYFLPTQSLGSKDALPEPPFTQSTQEFFRNKVSSCLNMIIAGHKNASTVACQVVQSVGEMDQNGEYGKLVIDMGEEIRESVDSAFKILKRIQHKEKKNEEVKMTASIQALKLLYSITILQVYNGDADAVSMLDELRICYDKFLGQKKSDVADVAEASEVLVEILLSFASKQSQLFRRISEQVFAAFADRVTARGLQSLIAILEAKDNLVGQQEMFENDDEESDVAMIDSDDLDDDVEEVNQSAESSSDSEEVSSNEGDDNESENGDELEEFDAKLAAALGTHRADKDLDAGSETSSDSDMDDDQMEALDEQLAQVFKARSQMTNKKKEKKEARENMINFKNRALDLLEIYVKKSHSNIIATSILLPLLQVTRKTKVQQIAHKASNVLREYCKLCKGTSVPAIEDEEPIWELLGLIHEEATHSGPAFHAATCSQASLLVVKMLVARKKENVERIVDVYAESRKKQLLSKKCHIQPAFFSDWNNWSVSASKQMKE
ncbi:DNA-directed DNA polymerase [Emydomyces testavorans]|uniref:DNA-directed DNA polymerase n=1 Tax=Emydomyces testavorans TaxID=2070801 RepID=A0AAF0DG91_9EURO|nr:DNA-directed DNA polymerase [Emydomyces testavorans]